MTSINRDYRWMRCFASLFFPVAISNYMLKCFVQTLISTPVQWFMAWRIKVITRSKVLTAFIWGLSLASLAQAKNATFYHERPSRPHYLAHRTNWDYYGRGCFGGCRGVPQCYGKVPGRTSRRASEKIPENVNQSHPTILNARKIGGRPGAGVTTTGPGNLSVLFASYESEDSARYPNSRSLNDIEMAERSKSNGPLDSFDLDLDYHDESPSPSFIRPPPPVRVAYSVSSISRTD
ncbi:hypothetical protein WG66_004034 [Moniliophthora roreri]|nr:hypothetical protein WG66_004034 [Moniliophthora roreri]